MGNFFTSSQIYNNEDLNSQKFIDKFCMKMAEEGYVSCDSDESELSYILRFGENCKWVTITSEAYEEGNQTSQKDTGRIAKMLKTVCVNTVVNDSDFAVMDLYDESGKKADTLIMGRADDYFGDEIPQPSEKIWKPFLHNGSTWEKLSEIRNGNYVFIEEGLSELAPVIGMDACNITFSAEDADEGDKYAFFLDFKKARSAITMSQNGRTIEKPAKKLTLNAAFKQIFGEALEPLGFQVTKGRYPYFVRVINGEILHIITLKTEQAEYPEDKAFSILGGIATVYRHAIDLGISPMANYNWLRNDVADFYIFSIDTDPDPRLVSILSQFNYFSEVPKSLTCVMKEALEYTKKYAVSFMDNINTLEKCIVFLEKNILITTAPMTSGLNFTNGSEDDDGLIYLKTNYRHHKELWKEIIEGKKTVTDEEYNRAKEYYKFFIDQTYIQGLSSELEKRKKRNLNSLSECGIISF